MKKFGLILLFSFVLFGVCGCNSKENNILGKWTSEQNNEYGWVFRKNGKCSFIGPTYADETLISYEDCEWELNGDKITIVEKIKITNGSISYENTDTTIATIKGDTMTIDNGGVYKKK